MDDDLKVGVQELLREQHKLLSRVNTIEKKLDVIDVDTAQKLVSEFTEKAEGLRSRLHAIHIQHSVLTELVRFPNMVDKLRGPVLVAAIRSMDEPPEWWIKKEPWSTIRWARLFTAMAKNGVDANAEAAA